jgi:hypothetical protein
VLNTTLAKEWKKQSPSYDVSLRKRDKREKKREKREKRREKREKRQSAVRRKRD